MRHAQALQITEEVALRADSSANCVSLMIPLPLSFTEHLCTKHYHSNRKIVQTKRGESAEVQLHG